MIPSPTGKEQTLAPVRANAGLAAAYYKRMAALIRAMADDVSAVLERHYARAESRIAQDDSPVADLKTAMTDLTRKWEKRFGSEASSIAGKFIKSVQAHGSRAAKAHLKAAGMTIEFRPTRRQQEVLSAAIAENTKLIKSIPAQYLDDVNGIVNRGIMRGGDLGEITKELKARYGVTQRRAAFIARQENRNATAAFNRQRDLDLGLEEGIWVHSAGGREPRPSHVKAGRERLRFKIAEGALIDGEHILPGEKFNCRCYYRAVLPGFNG